jgi:D-arabinan exo alpha-(1,3)/(1,5)-arabinofuranosidase (non-reducing end)
MNRSIAALLAVLAFGNAAIAADPPVIPIGLDAYRMWDKWPYHRIGARAYMRSTYDRRGGNEGADASHFLYQLGDDFNVSLDVAGSGVLYFVRCNHWHGSPWHYEVDGKDHIVQETSTANPNKPVPDSVFMPEHLFPNPLTWTWSITKGADLMWVPIPFERTFRLAYSRTRYGTGYYIYHLYDSAAALSRPIWSWDGRTPPRKDVLDLIARAGSNIAPRAKETNGTAPKIRIEVDKSSMVRLLSFSVPRNEALQFGRARITARWDDLKQSSIDAPVALFFGAGTLYNRDKREFLVKAFPMNIRYDADRVHLACYFPMPFRKTARVEIGDYTGELKWSARYESIDDPFEQVAYFHATYRDHPSPEPGKDLVLLDTRETEGGGDWSGNFVGTSWIFSHSGNLNTLEGDPRFFFDDSQSPQAYGTGTEEWGGGGDYWGGRNMTLPFAGHPCGAQNPKEAKEPEDLIQSAYRFLLADLMPFGKNAVIRLEHGGENASTEHYETVTYWYGANKPTLIKTDELKIGDSGSEDAHKYKSPDASEPYEITSRYELGVDKIGTQVVYEAHSDRGRKTKGASEFELKVRPDNYGVLLRRKLDYSFANQRAEVYVDDELAGIWYLAGSNTCIYSNPKEELGATQHNVQTSNRRFRDDEFIISRRHTRGKSSIRVRVKFTPVETPLFPGHPVPELAWSEIRYDAYCWVMPN